MENVYLTLHINSLYKHRIFRTHIIQLPYLLVFQLFQAFLTPIASGGHVTSYDKRKFLGL